MSLNTALGLVRRAKLALDATSKWILRKNDGGYHHHCYRE
jgi:hypothetical protein